MSDKFQNKYRISSSRLQSWDYSSKGAYFITICTKDRAHYFGEIVNQKMKLSNVGVIADLMWYEIKNHAKDIELGEFVVMPNHIHGILILNGDGKSNIDGDRNGNVTVETRHALSLPHALSLQMQPPEPQPPIGQNRFQNQGKNTVSSIIGSYKSTVTKHVNRLGFELAWQSRFHDHIIRDTQSFEYIQQYILNNPSRWKEDKFYS
ncbi:MAG TPA: transposase [Cytophagales bacterium]|nr:transposase [Cytophagales bacterium]